MAVSRLLQTVRTSLCSMAFLEMDQTDKSLHVPLDRILCKLHLTCNNIIAIVIFIQAK